VSPTWNLTERRADSDYTSLIGAAIRTERRGCRVKDANIKEIGPVPTHIRDNCGPADLVPFLIVGVSVFQRTHEDVGTHHSSSYLSDEVDAHDREEPDR
jgi:hypothetical protein